jgi:hypothetical protein
MSIFSSLFPFLHDPPARMALRIFRQSPVNNTVYLPWAAKNSLGWTTGYTALNPDFFSTISVTAIYYDQLGSIVHSETYTLPPLNVVGRSQSNDPLPNGWVGTIVLRANGPIVPIMRQDSSDTTSAYNGIVR